MATLDLEVSYKLDILINSGDTIAIDATIVDGSSVPINLTTYDIAFTAYDKSGNEVLSAVYPTDITVGGGSSNIMYLRKDCSMTKGQYPYKIVFTNSSDIIQTWFYGNINVKS